MIYYLAAALTVRTQSVRDYLLQQHANKTKDGGDTTQTVIIIAALSVLAIGVVGVITYKVMHKVNSINLDGGPRP